MTKPKTINVPTASYLVLVNEEYSEKALRFICEISQKNNSLILLLHVIKPADYQAIGMIADKMRREMHDDSQKLLKKLAEKIHAYSGITPLVMVREGLAEEEIISVVKEDKTIVMLITAVMPESIRPNNTVPILVSALGSKLLVPMLVVPDNLV